MKNLAKAMIGGAVVALGLAGTSWATELDYSGGYRGDAFGQSVSISGATAVVGAFNGRTSSIFSGSAYAYRNLDLAGATKLQDSKLIASDGGQNDQLGFSVSISGTTAIAGAPRDNPGGDSSQNVAGSAYVYRNLDISGATQTQSVKLTASDREGGDNFGDSVSISGTIAIVGAHYDNDSGRDSGSAYVFRDLDFAVGSSIL